MVKEFQIIDEMSKCTGCATCANLCPVSAIEMVRAAEGFEFPEIDFDTCVYCKKCIVQCPINFPEDAFANTDSAYFAGWSADAGLHQNSSSGGIFPEIALSVIASGGLVCGASFDENNELRHTIISQKEELPKLCGSKYLQSRIGNVYKEMRPFLVGGRKILFAGTPCQVAGVRSFFSRFPKQLANLYCIDVLCHSVPSPTVFAQYLHDVCAEKPSEILFREKSFGWNRFSLKLSSEKQTLLHKTLLEDPYLCGFLSDLFSRKACEGCRYARLEREGDITLGDFWGAEHYRPDYDHKGGVSLILVNSKKGHELLDSVRPRMALLDAIGRDDAMKSNAVLYSSMHASPNRAEFFDRWIRKKEPLIPLMKELSRKSHRGFLGKIRRIYYFAKSQFCARRMYVEPEDRSKKVAVLSASFGGERFGDMLTSYSIQQVLLKMGYTPYVLHFNPTFFYSWLPSRLSALVERIRFVKFRYSFLNTTCLYPSAKSLHSANRDFDTFLLAIDQMWRCADSKGDCEACFGKFASEGKRLIGYTSIFGGNRQSETVTSESRGASCPLGRLTSISANRDSVVDDSKGVLSSQHENMLDPTLLLHEVDYADIYTRASMRALSKKPFIACADSCGSDISPDIVRKASAILDCEARNILTRKVSIAGIEKAIYYSVSDWLHFIRSSQLIITDSFHCVAFSILFEKPFICLPGCYPDGDRIRDLLKKLELSDRMLGNIDDMEGVLASCIDYMCVRKRLDACRKASFSFLRGALNAPVPSLQE